VTVGRFIAIAAAAGAWALSMSAHAADAVTVIQPPAPARQVELIRLVRHDCGSCHGMTLNGGLGPALSKAALAGRPQVYLQQVILRGLPGTAMPPWAPLLSEQEAEWIARELQKGFPDVH
jgi:cytochrome c55X